MQKETVYVEFVVTYNLLRLPMNTNTLSKKPIMQKNIRENVA